MDQIQVAQTWLQKHQTLIIVALVLGSVLWITGRVLNLVEKHADSKETAALQQLQQQTTKDVQLAAQVNQLSAQYAAVASQLSVKDAQIAAALASRNAALQQQQAVDKTMPLPDLATRWSHLAGFDQAQIAASPDGLTVSDTASRTTVSALEKIPVLERSLEDAQGDAAEYKAAMNDASSLIGGLNSQVNSLKVTVVDTQKACTATISDVQAKAKKSKLRWFKAGFVTGFVSGLWAGHSI